MAKPFDLRKQLNLPDVPRDFSGILPLAGACHLKDHEIHPDADCRQACLRNDPRMAAFVFRRRGEMWTLRFDGEGVHMKDSVGLAYIARLLCEPDRDIPAVSLLAARAGIDLLVVSGSSGEVLDGEARAKYQRRYYDLREDLAEALANCDLGRIERRQKEMEQLATELAKATGLGGRNRWQSDTERVRKSVSMAVARDIKNIGKLHKPLGRHLGASISSGRVFRYAPPTPIDWLT